MDWLNCCDVDSVLSGIVLFLRRQQVERVMGIEPTLVAWEATVLPLNYTRLGITYRGTQACCRIEPGEYTNEPSVSEASMLPW